MTEARPEREQARIRTEKREDHRAQQDWHIGPLPRARPVSILPPDFLEGRCIRGNVERSSISVEDHPRSLFRGVADAVALPGPRSGEVIAPGLNFVVRGALLLMTMATEYSFRFLFRYSGQLLAIVSLNANCAFL